MQPIQRRSECLQHRETHRGLVCCFMSSVECICLQLGCLDSESHGELCLAAWCGVSAFRDITGVQQTRGLCVLSHGAGVANHLHCKCEITDPFSFKSPTSSSEII